MKEKYYIGTLALEIETEFQFSLWTSDEKFCNEILKPSCHIPIKLELVSKLKIPAKEGYTIPSMTIWKENNREIRLYNDKCDGEKYIMSCNENDSVTVFVQQDAWEIKYTKFRPWFYIHLEQLLLENYALILHSASIIYNGQAILFTAPSGTGKSTQTDLWHQYRSGVSDLNGDRTLLQWTPEGWYACGFPIYGSSVRCEQAAAPIGAIVIVRQADKDQIKELSLVEKVTLLYSEITVLSMEQKNIDKAMELIEKLTNQVRIIQLNCTKQESAVNVLHKYLYGE